MRGFDPVRRRELATASWAMLFVMVSGVALVGCGGGPEAPAEGGGSTVDCAGLSDVEVAEGHANPFELPSVENECVSLDEYAGQVILIDFWATWCPPCRDEIPELVALQRQYGGEGFQVIGISDESPDLVRDYVETHGVDYVNLIDPQGRVAGAYGVPGLPTAFLLDRDGNLVKRYFGAKPTGELEARVRSLLGLGPDA